MNIKEWVPAIIAGSLVSGLLVFWLGAVSVTGTGVDAPHGSIEYVLNRYQPLIAGLVAIAAAIIGANAVLHVAIEDRKRKARASRAILPLALSSLSDYAEQSFEAMRGLRDQCVGQLLPCPTPKAPPEVLFPDEPLSALATYVEHTDDDAAQALVTLMAKIQIQRSRCLETLRHASGIHARATPLVLNIETYMIDAAEIYARASALFDHARYGAPAAEIDGHRVVQALNLMGLDRFFEEELYARTMARASWDLGPR